MHVAHLASDRLQATLRPGYRVDRPAWHCKTVLLNWLESRADDANVDVIQSTPDQIPDLNCLAEALVPPSKLEKLPYTAVLFGRRPRGKASRAIPRVPPSRRPSNTTGRCGCSTAAGTANWRTRACWMRPAPSPADSRESPSGTGAACTGRSRACGASRIPRQRSRGFGISASSGVRRARPCTRREFHP